MDLRVETNASNILIHLKRISNNEFNIEITNSKDLEIPLLINVFENQEKIYSTNFAIKPSFSKRKIWFLNKFPDGKIRVNESFPIGYVIAEFRALTTHPEEQHKIR